jgi:hypothetical protein
MFARSFTQHGTEIMAPQLECFRSEDAKKYRFNIFIDNTCINIIGSTLEECLNQIACCGRLGLESVEEHNIPSPNGINFLFKIIATQALKEAILNKTPFEYLDIFATLNTDSNVVDTFSIASCLAGHLSSYSTDIYPSGIIMMGVEDGHLCYYEQGEKAFKSLKTEIDHQLLKLWSEANPVHSPHWDINLKRMLSPTLFNIHSIHNWIGARMHKLKYPRSSKLAYTVHLSPLVYSKDDPTPSFIQDVLPLTKSESIPVDEMKELIRKVPDRRVISLAAKIPKFLKDKNIFLVSTFNNPALLHPLRILAVSQSKQTMMMSLRIYKAKIHDIQSYLTSKCTKINNGIKLCAALSDDFADSSGSNSRLTEIMEEAASLPIQRIETIYQGEIAKIIGDINDSSPGDTLQSRLFRSINRAGHSLAWIDLLFKVTDLSESDQTSFADHCDKSGYEGKIDEVLETILTNADWRKANYRSPADIIDKMDSDDVFLLSRIPSPNEMVRQIIRKFCSYLTNNDQTTPEIQNLFPPKLTNSFEKILLSDSDCDDVALINAPEEEATLSALPSSPPSMSPINKNNSHSSANDDDF